MIQKFVDRFMAAKPAMRETFAQLGRDISYETIVRMVVEHVRGEEDEESYGDRMHPKRIHTIDDGDYQGTLLFVIAADTYQPRDYWYVKVGYGSCAGCDTLQDVLGYGDEPLSEKQLDELMPLSLHVVQGLKKMGGDDE